MVKTSQRRITKYAAKYRGSEYLAQCDLVEGGAKQDYGSQIGDWVLHRDLTVAVLNAEGVSSIQFGTYLAFSSQLWKLLKYMSGLALQFEAATLIAQYEAWGLAVDVLQKVRFQVYNIQAVAIPD